VLAKVWSPVLLPDPISVWKYLKGAAEDGTLLQASLVTMRRLLAGYTILRQPPALDKDCLVLLASANSAYKLGYSLQANAKTLEGSSHPDRNAHFEHIHRKVRCFLRKRS
jgi:hypothetical protein